MQQSCIVKFQQQPFISLQQLTNRDQAITPLCIPKLPSTLTENAKFQNCDQYVRNALVYPLTHKHVAPKIKCS